MRRATTKPIIMAVDTETTGRNVWIGARPFAVSIARSDGQTTWLEWEVDPKTRAPILSARDRREARALLGDRGVVKCFWNAKFDLFMLESVGVEVRGRVEEVSFKARSVFNLEPSYRLKTIAERYLSIGRDDERELHDAVSLARRVARRVGGFNIATKQTHGDKPAMADFWLPAALWRVAPEAARDAGVPRGVCRRYGMRDAERTLRLNELFDYGMRALDAEDRRLRVVETYEREMRLLPVTMDMERRGVTVDEREMRALRETCVREMRDAQTALDAAAGRPVNVNSTKQISALLFDKVGLKPTSVTAKGQPKTGSEALAPYRQHPVVRDLLRYRGNSKASRSFFDAYDKYAERRSDGSLVLHPGYNQWGALTGRFTCAEPNLQQVSDPTTTNSRAAEYVVNVRRVFVPPRGKVWYAPDYEQVEVVIFADVCGEPIMLQAIRDGVDVHTATTNKVWGGEGNPKAVPAVQRALTLKGLRATPDEALARLRAHAWDVVAVEAEMDVKLHRKLAKTVTFTKIFGGGVGALMSWIGCSEAEGRAILGDYDRAFPDMRRRMKQIEREGATNGYVVNRWGRRLAIDRWFAYRGVNYVVQSAAADLMKCGMIACAEYLRECDVDARIALTVHDELIFEFARAHAFRRVLRRLCDLMSDHGGRLGVATPVSMDRIVDRWSAKEKVDLS